MVLGSLQFSIKIFEAFVKNPLSSGVIFFSVATVCFMIRFPRSPLLMNDRPETLLTVGRESHWNSSRPKSVYTELNPGPFSIEKDTRRTGFKSGNSATHPILKLTTLFTLLWFRFTRIPIGKKVLTKLNGVPV